jgi:hypothetical protein
MGKLYSRLQRILYQWQEELYAWDARDVTCLRDGKNIVCIINFLFIKWMQRRVHRTYGESIPSLWTQGSRRYPTTETSDTPTPKPTNPTNLELIIGLINPIGLNLSPTTRDVNLIRRQRT